VCHQPLVEQKHSDHVGRAAQTVSGAVSVPQQLSGGAHITNSAGVLVSQINLGAQPAGLASYSWNGATTTAGGRHPLKDTTH